MALKDDSRLVGKWLTKWYELYDIYIFYRIFDIYIFYRIFYRMYIKSMNETPKNREDWEIQRKTKITI